MKFGTLVGVKIGLLVLRCTVEFSNKDSGKYSVSQNFFPNELFSIGCNMLSHAGLDPAFRAVL